MYISHYTVEILEFHCHDFVAKISSNQNFYYITK